MGGIQMAATSKAPPEIPAIETADLSRSYGQLLAVEKLNLNIRRGELFALLGPNGAGKSTTINMLCCLLKPTAGTARIMGFDINTQSYQVKSTIGSSPQETAISDHLTPVENLELFGRLNGVAPEKLKEWIPRFLEIMGLEDRAKSQVRTFSGGMKRRLSIMMALIHNPDVVFLDEPTLGLDPQVRHAMWEYIKSLKGQKTILLTTHYMEEADQLADRIGIMDQGKIVALGTPVELKQSLIKEPTMKIQAFNISQKIIADLKTFYPKVEFSGGTLSVSAEHLEFNEIVNRLQNAGAVIRSAQIKDPSLEDVYLKLTGKELRP